VLQTRLTPSSFQDSFEINRFPYCQTITVWALAKYSLYFYSELIVLNLTFCCLWSP
jgi:hypothetical protein